MGLQNIIRFLLPRDDHFYEFLERQTDLAHEGAVALARFADGTATVEETRDVVQGYEHDGDSVVQQMEEALAKTFVTPIDREDLHLLSAKLDDILDLTNDTIWACSLLGVDEPSEPMKKMMHLLVRCTETLQKAVPQLRHHAYSEIVEHTRALRKFETEADAIYREGLSALFSGTGVDEPRHARVLIREKTVLDDLERAVDHCDDVANTLTNLAVKHG